MARVTLVNPNRMKPAVAPLALDYLADALVPAHDVSILDLCFSEDWQADVESFFASNRPDVVGFSIRNTDDCYFASGEFFVPRFTEIIRHIREASDAPIVLGGAGLSTAPAAILSETGADYAVKGSGETAFPALVRALAEGSDVSELAGLVYRTPDGIRSNPPVWDANEVSAPRTRRWLDNRRYFAEGGQAGIETKRGCAGRCIYCADPVGKGSVCRAMSPKAVAAEIRTLLAQGIDCFHLCDSEFNIPPDHAEAVCREIADQSLGERIRWYTYASPKPFTDELAERMKRAGCEGIDFGADSGDDRVLESLGRDFTSEDVRLTAEICHRHGITFMYDLLIGGPAETKDSVRRTIELMKQIRPHRVGFSVGVRIYDGTWLSEMVRGEGFSGENPSLHGQIEGNESFLRPAYYLSSEVGLGVFDYIGELVCGDPRFLHASREQIEGNYNYNDNAVLVDAIRNGYRGAYWDVLRKLQEGLPP